MNRSQSSNGDTDTVNRLMDKGGREEGEGEVNRKGSMDACTPTDANTQPVGICCVTQGFKRGLCSNLEAWERVETGREIQEGGHICTPMVDSC